MEVISFAVSVLIIVSGGMKIARRSSITLHVEADESALRNTAKTFTEGFIWCVKHLESASRWSSVDHSLAVAACSWLIYRFVFILNMTVLSMRKSIVGCPACASALPCT